MDETITVGAPSADLVARVEYAASLASCYRVITCAEMREAASADLKLNKALQNEVETERTKISKPINLGLKNLNALFKRMSAPLEINEDVIKRACLEWDEAEDRKRRQSELEAARAADAERKRLEAEAEKQKEAGNAEVAQIIKEAAEMVAPVPVVNEAPKIAGESHREIWHAEVTDLRALALAVGLPRLDGLRAWLVAMSDALERKGEPGMAAETMRWHEKLGGEVPEEYVVGMMSTLNGVARALKGNMLVPGVKAVCTKILASRAA